MTFLAVLTSMSLIAKVDTVVYLGPLIALVTAISVAVITSRAQLRSAAAHTETEESSVLLTGYNQLVTALQGQVAEVQADYVDMRERMLAAEAEKAMHVLTIQELSLKHDREIALLHAEIAALRQQIRGIE